MEADAVAQLHRWFQTRANSQTQRPRVGLLSAAQLERLQAELHGIMLAAGGSSLEHSAGAMTVMLRAVFQYIESLTNLALDHAAASGGTDCSDKNVVAVLSRHNFYQATRSAAVTAKYKRIRSMTSIETKRITVEGYQHGACNVLSVTVQTWPTKRDNHLSVVCLSCCYRTSQKSALQVYLWLALLKRHYSKKKHLNRGPFHLLFHLPLFREAQTFQVSP